MSRPPRSRVATVKSVSVHHKRLVFRVLKVRAEHTGSDRCNEKTVNRLNHHVIVSFHNRDGIKWPWSETQVKNHYKLMCIGFLKGSTACMLPQCGKCTNSEPPRACDPHRCEGARREIAPLERIPKKPLQSVLVDSLPHHPPKDTGTDSLDGTSTESLPLAKKTEDNAWTTVDVHHGRALSSSTFSVISDPNTISAFSNDAETPLATTPVSSNPLQTSMSLSNAQHEAQGCSTDSFTLPPLDKTCTNLPTDSREIRLKAELEDFARAAKSSHLKEQIIKSQQEVKKVNNLVVKVVDTGEAEISPNGVVIAASVVPVAFCLNAQYDAVKSKIKHIDEQMRELDVQKTTLKEQMGDLEVAIKGFGSLNEKVEKVNAMQKLLAELDRR